MKIKGLDDKVIDVPKGAYKSIYEPMGYVTCEDEAEKKAEAEAKAKAEAEKLTGTNITSTVSKKPPTRKQKKAAE